MPTDQFGPQFDAHHPSTDVHISEILRVRAQEVVRILQEPDGTAIRSQLENCLDILIINPIADEDRIPLSRDMPPIFAIVQIRAD
jgi:hypothetical protein